MVLSQDPQAQEQPYLIPMEDDALHTNTSPFCYDPTCLCHEDETLIAHVAEAVNKGLLTPDEATNVVAGKTV